MTPDHQACLNHLAKHYAEIHKLGSNRNILEKLVSRAESVIEKFAVGMRTAGYNSAMLFSAAPIPALATAVVSSAVALTAQAVTGSPVVTGPVLVGAMAASIYPIFMGSFAIGESIARHRIVAAKRSNMENNARMNIEQRAYNVLGISEPIDRFKPHYEAIEDMFDPDDNSGGNREY